MTAAASSKHQSRKKVAGKSSSHPSEEDVEKLRKDWQTKRKLWKKDKGDKAARKAMRQAKKRYEDAKELLEDEDDDSDQDSNSPPKKEPKVTNTLNSCTCHDLRVTCQCDADPNAIYRYNMI